MRPFTSVTFKEFITISALVLAGFVILDQSDTAKTLSALVDRLTPPAARSVIQDALIGQTVALPPVRKLAKREEGEILLDRTTVVWVVDSDGCSNCLDAVAEWNHLAAANRADMHLVVITNDAREVHRYSRAVRNTSVWVSGQQDVQRALGRVLANTKLVLAPGGAVLLADTRSSGLQCGWSFEGQVSALFGVSSPDRIRADPLAADRAVQFNITS